MCGFAGFILKDGCLAGDMHSRLTRMTDRIVHRGPDSSGFWCDEKHPVALGHRRLSILDLSEAGHQPMVSPSGRYVIVLNGEIYNFREIRKRIDDCPAHQAQFKGHSDTEILLHAIEVFGLNATLKMATGMFAFALWDRKEKALFLARDRFGEKPLYYGFCDEGLVFASELFCFKEFARSAWEIDPQAITLYFRHNYIPAPYSILRNVRKLLPGHFVKICLDEVAAGSIDRLCPEAYWDVFEHAGRGFATAKNESAVFYEDALEKLLKEAVSRQMVADVPVGAFLSGGIDSSLIVGLMQSVSLRPVKTFSIGFSEPRFDEAGYAREVARHLGTDHTELYVTPQMALDVVPSLAKYFSEPFADSSQIPTHLVCRMARRDVTVALSGDAGDELFGGYERYFYAHRLWELTNFAGASLRKRVSRLIMNCGRLTKKLSGLSPVSSGRMAERLIRVSDMLGYDNFGELYKRLLSHVSSPENFLVGDVKEPKSILDRLEKPDFWPTDFERMMFADLVSYLPDDIMVKLDRSAMAVSLETRVPFLDHSVVEFSFGVPSQLKVQNGQGKQILRNLLYKYVPRHLIDRPKKGFGVPVAEWLKADLKDWAWELLNPERLAREGLLNPETVLEFWNDHQSNRRSCGYVLWDVLMFQSWLAEWRK